MNFSSDEVFRLVDLNLGGPFRWGKQDCLLSCSNVFQALTGVDIAKDVRGAYCSRDGAERILGGFGGSLLIYMKVRCSVINNLWSLEDGREAPVGAIGVSHPGISQGLDGRCVCIKVKQGAWASKALRGFTFVTEVERCWHA